MWYFAWGRLAYNAELPESAIQAEYRAHFGESGDAVHRAFQFAGAIVPTILSYRFQGPDQRDYSPETETGCWLDNDPEQSFLQSEPMDARSFASIAQYVDAAINGVSDGRITPPRVVRILEDAALNTETEVSRISGIENEPQWNLLRTDLLAQVELGRYYAERIRGCTHLAYALKTGSQRDYDLAVKFLTASRAHWGKLAGITDRVYAPLDNPLRAQRKFKWSKLLAELNASDANNPAALWAQRTPDLTAPALAWNDASANAGAALSDVLSVQNDGRVNVSCKPMARDGVAGVVLWHTSLPSQNAWQPTVMQAEADGVYSASVTDDAQGLLYEIEVQTVAKGAALFPDVLKERPYWVIEPTKMATMIGKAAAVLRTKSE